MRLRPAVTILVFAMAAALASAFVQDAISGTSIKRPFDTAAPSMAADAGSPQILYHGGPVMNKSNSVYVIYYGNFVATTEPVINDFLMGFNGSAHFGVNSTYNAGGQTPPVPSTYTFIPPDPSSTANPSGSVYFDNYSSGTELGNRSVAPIIAHAIESGCRAIDMPSIR